MYQGPVVIKMTSLFLKLYLMLAIYSVVTFGQENGKGPSLDVLRKELRVRLLKELADFHAAKKAENLKHANKVQSEDSKSNEKLNPTKVATSMRKLRILGASGQILLCCCYGFRPFI